MELNKYHAGVDFNFLKANGINIRMYQPWQIGLFCEELEGKFVWYPKKGTLMYETEFNGSPYTVKIGDSGDFLAQTKEQEEMYGSTERVYNEIIKKVKSQQNG